MYSGKWHLSELACRFFLPKWSLFLSESKFSGLFRARARKGSGCGWWLGEVHLPSLGFCVFDRLRGAVWGLRSSQGCC